MTICIVAGLVSGEAFSIDASLIKADVDKHKRLPGDQPIDWPAPEEASRAVRAYLAALEAAHRDDEGDGGNGGDSSGGSRAKPPKEVSLTDPQAAWVTRKSMDPFFAYDANYLIDNKPGIIVDAEETRANRSDEIAATETLIERVPASSIRDAFFPTGRARTIARSARSNLNAQRRSPARSPAISTRTCAIRCARWPTPKLSRSRVGERKKVEMRFAHMKRIHRLDRLRLRGLAGAKDEVLLTATAQNLRRLAKLLCRSPPHAGACVAQASGSVRRQYRCVTTAPKMRGGTERSLKNQRERPEPRRAGFATHSIAQQTCRDHHFAIYQSSTSNTSAVQMRPRSAASRCTWRPLCPPDAEIK